MEEPDKDSKPSLNNFLSSLYLSLLEDKQFDPDVVKLIIQHLGQDRIHSQAGKRLAEDIIALAKERSIGGNL